MALFALGDDCSVNHFAQMSLVFDITLCGQAAGPEFASDCPGRGKGSSSMGQCIVRPCPISLGCWVAGLLPFELRPGLLAAGFRAERAERV